MITLYGYPNTRSLRVLWMLEELNIPYEYQLTPPFKAQQSPDFVQLNPSCKIPVLTDGSLVLTESAAIITYLADQNPESRLAPNVGTHQRAHYDQWCYFSMSELEQPLWTMAKHSFIFEESMRVQEINQSALWEFKQILQNAELQLSQHDYITGKSFSAADILITTTLLWAKQQKIDIETPVITQYLQKTTTRKAFLSAIAIEQEKSA